jgi:hypothetical protein
MNPSSERRNRRLISFKFACVFVENDAVSLCQDSWIIVHSFQRTDIKTSLDDFCQSPYSCDNCNNCEKNKDCYLHGYPFGVFLMILLIRLLERMLVNPFLIKSVAVFQYVSYGAKLNVFSKKTSML